MNLSSIKSYHVAKYLLNHQLSSQTEISKGTDVAIGYVNQIVHELSNLNMIRVEYGKCVLQDYAKLLEKISFDRPFNSLKNDELRLPTSSIKVTEQALAQYCRINNTGYAFTSFSALKHYYEYHISYPTIHIYVENPRVIQGIEKGEGAIPVIILKSDRPDILTDSVTMGDYQVCEKIQVIIDLYSSGIGRDAAIRFYRDSIWKNQTY